MFAPTTLLTYIVAAFALVLAPGPNQALVLANSISHGRRAGIVTSLGANVGTMVHTLAAALGLSAILATSALVFGMVKYVGAAYLVYLGVRAIMDRSVTMGIAEDGTPTKTLHQTFTRAIAVGILNPKVALFFLAFLPQFVDPARGAVVLQFLVLGVILATLGLMWDSMLASVAGRVGKWL